MKRFTPQGSKSVAWLPRVEVHHPLVQLRRDHPKRRWHVVGSCSKHSRQARRARASPPTDRRDFAALCAQRGYGPASPCRHRRGLSVPSGHGGAEGLGHRPPGCRHRLPPQARRPRATDVQRGGEGRAARDPPGVAIFVAERSMAMACDSRATLSAGTSSDWRLHVRYERRLAASPIWRSPRHGPLKRYAVLRCVRAM